MNITKQQARRLIDGAGSTIFTAEFVKKDGTKRVMNCRLSTHVTKYKVGGELKYNPQDFDLIPVFDMQADAYRMINLKTLSVLKIKGKEFQVK